MLFTLGIIVGLLIASVILFAVAFFRSPIEKHFAVMGQKIDGIRPKQKGAIFLPESENELTRQALIAKNSREGKDTPIKDLM